MATGALISLVPKLLGLIPKLGKLLKNEYSLAKKVEKDIEDLVKELEVMQAFLEDECSKPTEELDKRVQLFARDVREMSYRIEDQIDIFLVRVEGKHEQARPRNIKRLITKPLASLAKIKTRHNIAGEIKDIMGQVKKMKERHDRYHIGNAGKSPSPLVDPRLEALYKMVTELVGIDEPMGELIKMLTDGDDMSKEKLKTVSVVGVGGLGKTTLAKAVYDKLKLDFKYCAFVPVGQNPKVETVLNTIHCDLRGHKCEMETTYFITKSLRDFLTDKRYLIVIDDIWDNKHWAIIKHALVENNYGSRVITTTRKFDVANKTANKTDQVYKLKPLSDDNSKKLFCTRIFHCTSTCQDYQLDEVPQQIVSKCHGVPLAIITMASLLADKPRKEWPAMYSSIGFRESNNDAVENTKRILSFSFYDMPSHLRACLLYLGAYPEEMRIDKDNLIFMWIAEGFVQDGQGDGLFVLGERYFFELMNRSMIQPATFQSGEIYLHDMVLALIRSLCVEYNFITILDNEQGTSAQNNIVRRLSYQCETIMEQDLKSEKNMVSMRSFVAVYGFQIDKIDLFSRFKGLRVLSLESCSFMEDCSLKFLGELLHLRYLNLCDTGIRELPEELGALKFLQSLNIEGTHVEELPSWIGLFTQLVCLICDCDTRPPVDGAIAKLTSLEKLQISAPKEESARKKFLTDLANLRELRKLFFPYFEGKMDESMAAALLEALCNMSKLTSVQIDFDYEVGVLGLDAAGLMLSPYLRVLVLTLPVIEFFRLPNCINSSQLPNLSELSLRVRSVDMWDMRTLGALPELCYLRLNMESKLLVVDGGYPYFRKLRSCSLHMRDGIVVFLPDWSGAPIMPSLKDLSLVVNAYAMKKYFYLGYGQGISFIQTMIALRNFPSLKNVTIIPIGYNISTCTIKAEVEKALRHAIGDHCYLHISFFDSDRITSCDTDIMNKVIRFSVPVAWLNGLGFDFDYSYLGTLPSLEKVIADINCESATPCVVEEAIAGLRHAVDAHPNFPMLEMVFYTQDKIEVLRYPDLKLGLPNHYVATQDKENDGLAPASVVTAAEKEGEKQQLLSDPRRPLSRLLLIKHVLTQHPREKNTEPQDPWDVFEKEYNDAVNFAPPVKEFNGGIDLNMEGGIDLSLERPTENINDRIYLNLGVGIDSNLEQSIEEANDGIDLNLEVGIDLNLESPIEHVNDLIDSNLKGRIDLNFEPPTEDVNDGIDLNFKSPIEDVNDWIDLNLKARIDLNLEQPIEDANDGNDLTLEGGIDLNLDPPAQNESELADLFRDLVLGDQNAEQQDGALSYMPPGEEQAVGVGFGDHGGKTREDPDDELYLLMTNLSLQILVEGNYGTKPPEVNSLVSMQQ